MSARRLDDSDDDDEDAETEALLAEIGAEASSLSRWCASKTSAEIASSAHPSPSSLSCRGDDRRHIETTAVASNLCEEPYQSSEEKSTLIVPSTAQNQADNAVFTISSGVGNASMPQKASSERSILEALAAGLGPLRLMAWAAAFVVAITLLAILMPATRSISTLSPAQQAAMAAEEAESARSSFSQDFGLAGTTDSRPGKQRMRVGHR
mmetsp:Transcript_56969/g.90230  ORF Transcript_56969/g.90230 Transcript_56969/m.90230 type:complete len:209 (-) Transcript_56969:5-631(-)